MFDFNVNSVLAPAVIEINNVFANANVYYHGNGNQKNTVVSHTAKEKEPFCFKQQKQVELNISEFINQLNPVIQDFFQVKPNKNKKYSNKIGIKKNNYVDQWVYFDRNAIFPGFVNNLLDGIKVPRFFYLSLKDWTIIEAIHIPVIIFITLAMGMIAVGAAILNFWMVGAVMVLALPAIFSTIFASMSFGIPTSIIAITTVPDILFGLITIVATGGLGLFPAIILYSVLLVVLVIFLFSVGVLAFLFSTFFIGGGSLVLGSPVEIPVLFITWILLPLVSLILIPLVATVIGINLVMLLAKANHVTENPKQTLAKKHKAVLLLVTRLLSADNRTPRVSVLDNPFEIFQQVSGYKLIIPSDYFLNTNITKIVEPNILKQDNGDYTVCEPSGPVGIVCHTPSPADNGNISNAVDNQTETQTTEIPLATNQPVPKVNTPNTTTTVKTDPKTQQRKAIIKRKKPKKVYPNKNTGLVDRVDFYIKRNQKLGEPDPILKLMEQIYGTKQTPGPLRPILLTTAQILGE